MSRLADDLSDSILFSLLPLPLSLPLSEDAVPARVRREGCSSSSQVSSGEHRKSAKHAILTAITRGSPLPWGPASALGPLFTQHITDLM